MHAGTSVDKSWQQLWDWQQSDPRALVDYTFELQAEVRRLRDASAQNSRNSSRPPSGDRPEQPKPKSLRKKSGRKTGGQPGHPGRTLQFKDNPEHIKVHPVLECHHCGEDCPKSLPSTLNGDRYSTCLPSSWSAPNIAARSRNAAVVSNASPPCFPRMSKPPCSMGGTFVRCWPTSTMPNWEPACASARCAKSSSAIRSAKAPCKALARSNTKPWNLLK